MRRGLYVCLLLIALLISSVTLARAVGGLQAPIFHAWLRHADGTPCAQACLFGASPDGTLSFEAARAILAAHPLTQGAELLDRGLIVHWRSEAFMLSIGRTHDSEQLAWINLQIAGRDLRVSDIIAAYGTPNYVSATNDRIITDLLYRAHHLQVSALREALPTNAPLRLRHRVYNLYLMRQEQFEALLRQIGGNLKAWRGFVPITHYLNRPSRVASP